VPRCARPCPVRWRGCGAFFTAPVQHYISAQGFVEDVLELEEAYSRKHRALPARLLLLDDSESFAPLVARLNSRSYDRLTLAYQRMTVPVVFAEPGEVVTKGLLWAFAQSEQAVG
jgi:hypothetical protein